VFLPDRSYNISIMPFEIYFKNLDIFIQKDVARTEN
jgi:hypothetical protein